MVLPAPIRWKALWGATQMAQYLVGVLAAADQARREGVEAISVIEFGVASGEGLKLIEGMPRRLKGHRGDRSLRF
jgi:hypothetical protein